MMSAGTSTRLVCFGKNVRYPLLCPLQQHRRAAALEKRDFLDSCSCHPKIPCVATLQPLFLRFRLYNLIKRGWPACGRVPFHTLCATLFHPPRNLKAREGPRGTAARAGFKPIVHRPTRKRARAERGSLPGKCRRKRCWRTTKAAAATAAATTASSTCSPTTIPC